MNEIVARIKYSKKYPANLIGHLDTITALQRSMIMAAWPFKFTQGFNPRVKMSSAPPLSLGFYSDVEYLDVTLRNPVKKYQIEKFKNSTIKGLNIEHVRILLPEEPAINEELNGFRYLIEFRNSDTNPVTTLENIVEKGKGYIILDIYKKNGGFRNPKKLLGKGNYKIKKIKCIWNKKLVNSFITINGLGGEYFE